MEGKQLDATRIDSRLLLKVLKVAEIYEVIITKNSSRPVTMLSADGKKYNLTKDELITNFATLHGKRISLISMKNNQTYLVARLLNTPCYAVKLPKGTNKTILMPNGTVLKAGKVLVIRQQDISDNAQYCDMSTGKVMSEAIFRKTCVLKGLSPELEKRLAEAKTFNKQVQATGESINNTANPQTEQSSLGQPSFSFDMGDEPETSKVEQPKEESSFSFSFDMGDEPETSETEQPKEEPNFSFDMGDEPETQQKPVIQSKPIPTPTSNSTPDTPKGNIIKVKKVQLTDEVVGYTVIAQGQIYELTVPHVMKLCSIGAISNATLVTNANGTRYLRGVGTNLEELPVEYI